MNGPSPYENVILASFSRPVWISLAAVGLIMTWASTGYRTVSAQVMINPTLARENPYWPRKRCENTPYYGGEMKRGERVKR